MGKGRDSRALKYIQQQRLLKQADIIMILINDEKQADMYKKDIEPNLEAGNMLDVRSWFQHSLSDVSYLRQMLMLR